MSSRQQQIGYGIMLSLIFYSLGVLTGPKIANVKYYNTDLDGKGGKNDFVMRLGNHYNFGFVRDKNGNLVYFNDIKKQKLKTIQDSTETLKDKAKIELDEIEKQINSANRRD